MMEAFRRHHGLQCGFCTPGIVLRIKHLLYEQGFTISGARQQLRTENKADKTQSAIPFPSHSKPEIQHIRQGLREILNLLSARRTG